MNLKNFKEDLKALLKKYDVSIGGDYEGDSYGIYNERFIVVDKYSKEITLTECYMLINASDL